MEGHYVMAVSQRLPVLSEEDTLASDQFADNCGPISIAALIQQPYGVVHNHCELYDWAEGEGIDIIDLILIIRDFGYRTRFLHRFSYKKITLARAKREILRRDRKYLIWTDGHVMAWVYGEIVDSYDCNGRTEILEIVEVR